MEPAALEIDGSVMEGVSCPLFALGTRGIVFFVVCQPANVLLTQAAASSGSPVLAASPALMSDVFPGVCCLQGGQILRVSAALSCISGSSIKISKIRAGRSTPGLR